MHCVPIDHGGPAWCFECVYSRSPTAVVKEAARALSTGLRILAPLLKVPY